MTYREKLVEAIENCPTASATEVLKRQLEKLDAEAAAPGPAPKT